jgi:hypothetical protein
VHGPLHEISLIEVLQLLERGRRSGVVRVVGPDDGAPRTISLHRGLITAVEPDANDAAVQQALRRRFLIGADDPVGEVSLSVREELRGRLARNAVEMMMRWNRGRFDFAEGDTAAGPLSWSADALVMALIGDESIRVELASQLSDWHAVPRFAPAGVIAAGGALSLTAVDWRILDAVDGLRDIAAIAATLDEPLEMVGMHVTELARAAILQIDSPPENATLEAHQALEAGEYDAAAGRLRGRVERAPHDAEAWRALGLAEVGAGRFEAAIEAWTVWRQAAPERAAEADSLIQAARTMMEALLEHRE